MTGWLPYFRDGAWGPHGSPSGAPGLGVSAESEVSARVSQANLSLGPGSSESRLRPSGSGKQILGLLLQDARVVGARALGLRLEVKGAGTGPCRRPLRPSPHVRVPARPRGRVSHRPCHAWRPAQAAEADARPGAKRKWARFRRAPVRQEAPAPARGGRSPGPASLPGRPARRAPTLCAPPRGRSSAGPGARAASNPECSAVS